MAVLYVLLYEVTTASRRLLYCFVAPVLPSVFVPLLLFFVDMIKLDWSLSQLVVATLSLLLLPTFYVVEESPTWLLATHNVEEAEKVVRRAGSVNSVSQIECRRQFRSEVESYRREQADLPSDNTMGIFRSEWLRGRSLILVFVWLVISWAYSHHVEERGTTSDTYVRSATLLGLGPMFVIVWPDPGARPGSQASHRHLLPGVRRFVCRRLRRIHGRIVAVANRLARFHATLADPSRRVLVFSHHQPVPGDSAVRGYPPLLRLRHRW
ncbi:hypothetical protein MTO96_019476 [Rhipicephalus appendiculatus]